MTSLRNCATAQLITAPATQPTTALASGDCNPNTFSTNDSMEVNPSRFESMPSTMKVRFQTMCEEVLCELQMSTGSTARPDR